MSDTSVIQAARAKIVQLAVQDYNSFGWINGAQQLSPHNPRIAAKKCADPATRARQGARKLAEIFADAGVPNPNVPTLSVEFEKAYANDTMTREDRNQKDVRSWCGIFALSVLRRAGLKKLSSWPLKVSEKNRDQNQFETFTPGQMILKKMVPEMGDVCVRDYRPGAENHHFIVLSSDTAGNMWTIDGNSGLNSEITLNRRSLREMQTVPSAIYKPIWDRVL